MQLVVGVAVVMAFVWQSLVRSDAQLGVQRSHLVLATITFPAWTISFSLNKLYQARAVERPTEELRRIVNASLVAIGVIVAFSFVFQFKSLSRLWILSLFTFVVVGMAVERTVARRIFTKMRRAGAICRPVVIVGTDADAVALLHAAQRTPNLGYRVVGFVGDDDIGVRGGCVGAGRHRPDRGDPRGDRRDRRADLALVGRVRGRQPPHPGPHRRRLPRRPLVGPARHRRRAVPGPGPRRAHADLRRADPARRLAGGRQAGLRHHASRSSRSVLTAPITLVAAVGIKRSSPGPVLFAQERVGRDGHTFRVFKLRTMVVDAEARLAELEAQNEADGPLFKMTDDPRVTKVGAFLRKLSIDEIPQFINVLRGEMSVVGPRPALPKEVESWTDDVHDRLRVLPGITGMWQVSGRSDTTFDEYKRLDLYYVDNWSLAHDARIVCKTFAAVLAQRGAR